MLEMIFSNIDAMVIAASIIVDALAIAVTWKVANKKATKQKAHK